MIILNGAQGLDRKDTNPSASGSLHLTQRAISYSAHYLWERTLSVFYLSSNKEKNHSNNATWNLYVILDSVIRMNRKYSDHND